MHEDMDFFVTNVGPFSVLATRGEEGISWRPTGGRVVPYKTVSSYCLYLHEWEDVISCCKRRLPKSQQAKGVRSRRAQPLC